MKAWMLLTRIGTHVLITGVGRSDAMQTFVDNGGLESDIIEVKNAPAELYILMDSTKGGY